MPELVKQINATLAGWVNYFRVGNSSRAFSRIRDYRDLWSWLNEPFRPPIDLDQPQVTLPP